VATLVNVANSKQRARGPNVWSALEPARTINHRARTNLPLPSPTLVQIPWPHAGQRPGRTIAVITQRAANCADLPAQLMPWRTRTAVLLPANTTGSRPHQTTPTNRYHHHQTAHRGEMMLAAPTLVQTG